MRYLTVELLNPPPAWLTAITQKSTYHPTEQSALKHAEELSSTRPDTSLAVYHFHPKDGMIELYTYANQEWTQT